MQKQTISLSDFLGGWAELKLEMSKSNDNILAKRLMAQMKFREESLFNNKILNAAVFLDPRFQQFMPNKNKETAIGFLETLHRKITSIKCAQTEIVIHTNESQSNQEFEEFLNTIYEETGANDEFEENNNENQPSELAAEDIRTVLKQFIGVKEPLGSSVFEYWQNNMHLKPVLYELASVVHAVPPSQTTVERAFSAMALVLSPLLTHISNKNLENILLIRLNREIFDEISPLN